MITPSYGPVTGRVSSLALDPSDAAGNKLYVGTTGGGVWVAQNAATANTAGIVFTPLTDGVTSQKGIEPVISIGALTVQAGETGVILAGTGDPNDALDSYYGTGVLLSRDWGNTWTLISASSDLELGTGIRDFSFVGESFAGFAWSTRKPNRVVAAVTQSAEGQLVAAENANASYKGLYYSDDAGATWQLARISDGTRDVQGPLDGYSVGDGNAATAVVWNDVRKVFVAAIRFHGYYESADDGATWTRIASQPGPGLTTAMCPTNFTMTGSPACPIFRGALAVNPLTGDTFAWTVDLNNQDQGLWQDACAETSGNCPANVAFSKQWSTAPLDSDTWLGASTIANGDYNLALAAVPSGQDTLLLAGANDLWKCSLAMGCAWRNTSNSFTCTSAQIGPYQHALEWQPANQNEVFVGNDSGLWRSLDAIGEQGPACSSTDSSHWQNLNGGLGSLAEVESMSAVGASPYSMMAGLGANGTAGVKSTTSVTRNWPQILSGEGGPVVIDPANPDRWWVNNSAGVSIHLCSTLGLCTPADFGTAPAVSNTSVANDGLEMVTPAPFLVDPIDSTQLLIATCRLWRGPGSGSGWTAANVVEPMLDGNVGNLYCGGNALIRSMAAVALPGGGEMVYVGVYGALDGGATMAGHVLSAIMNASGNWSPWQDLTLNPVVNDAYAMNFYGLDVSGIAIDPHDLTGNTVYVTVAGVPGPQQQLAMVYRSVDGGAHWSVIDSGLPVTTANALAVDPVDANTVYLATDAGVYSTRSVSACSAPGAFCWTPFGASLPMAPVVALSASPAGANPAVLVAGTYGRGLWQIPLMTSGTPATTASASPNSLTFSDQTVGVPAAAQTATVTNTGASPLVLLPIVASGDFTETDNCGSPIVAGASCAVQVTFLPKQPGTRSGQLTISGNLRDGPLAVTLTGTGISTGSVTLSSGSIDFGTVELGSRSDTESVTVTNSGGTSVPITSITVTAPFVLTTNSCGTTSLAANSDCVLVLQFVPTAAGSATGTLTLIDGTGTQYAQLTGTGTSPPTDTLSPASLSFPATIIGQNSAFQWVTITNSGMNPLTSISPTVTGPFLLSNKCGSQLAAESKCSIGVQFQPSVQGVQTGTLTVSDILASQSIPLAGTGLLPPEFSVTPTSLAFPAQPVNVASSPITLTVTNSGGAPMADLGFQVSGQNATSFSTGANTCNAGLNAGAGCTIQVIFTPASAGSAVATLTITSSTPGLKAPAIVPLSGAGSAPSALTASPAQLTFAATALGQTSAAQVLTITNHAGLTAAGLTLTISGPFTLTQNTCGSSLAAGASCPAEILFAPKQKGALTGSLTIASTSLPVATNVPLSGTGGLTGNVQIAPGQVSFPATGVGATSNATTVTISNNSATVSLDNLVLTSSAGFKLSATTCGSSLAAGSSCTASIAFAPAVTGPQTGTLTLASSALAANATVALSGTGFDFTAVSAGSASQTVASGQTANYSVTLTPLGGVPQSLTFRCNSLPTYATCLFNPSTNSVAADATGTETVQISTSQSSGMAMPAPRIPEWKLIAFAGLLLMVPLATRRRRKLLAVALLLLTMSALSSCAGSGGGGGGSAPPPASHTVAPGTYSISLAVSSGSVQHTVTVTLVVD